ncbi:hypothetical protein L9F63_009936, partial [Diploptera punctata]
SSGIHVCNIRRNLYINTKLSVLRGEHRSAPAQPELANLNYYGGAGGNVLVYHPTLGFTPSKTSGQIESLKDDQEGSGAGGGGDGGGSDSVTVPLPPPGPIDRAVFHFSRKHVFTCHSKRFTPVLVEYPVSQSESLIVHTGSFADAILDTFRTRCPRRPTAFCMLRGLPSM